MIWLVLVCYQHQQHHMPVYHNVSVFMKHLQVSAVRVAVDRLDFVLYHQPFGSLPPPLMAYLTLFTTLHWCSATYKHTHTHTHVHCRPLKQLIINMCLTHLCL